MDVRMDLARIIIRDDDDQQIIVLAERDGERQFSIVVGLYEGWAIRRRVNGVESPRPMTHDLLANIIEDLNAELEKIVIHDLREHTFFAKLVIRRNGSLIEVDARPSDAIALGVTSAGSSPVGTSNRRRSSVRTSRSRATAAACRWVAI